LLAFAKGIKMRLLLTLLAFFSLVSICCADPWLYTKPIAAGPYQPTHYNLFVNGEPKGSATAVMADQLGSVWLVFDLAWFAPYYKTGANSFFIESCRHEICGPASNVIEFAWPYVESSTLKMQLTSPYYKRQR
jgi:hypothetical protein